MVILYNLPDKKRRRRRRVVPVEAAQEDAAPQEVAALEQADMELQASNTTTPEVHLPRRITRGMNRQERMRLEMELIESMATSPRHTNGAE